MHHIGSHLHDRGVIAQEHSEPLKEINNHVQTDKRHGGDHEKIKKCF
jgi:hypothetical protein